MVCKLHACCRTQRQPQPGETQGPSPGSWPAHWLRSRQPACASAAASQSRCSAAARSSHGGASQCPWCGRRLRRTQTGCPQGPGAAGERGLWCLRDTCYRMCTGGPECMHHSWLCKAERHHPAGCAHRTPASCTAPRHRCEPRQVQARGRAQARVPRDESASWPATSSGAGQAAHAGVQAGSPEGTSG